MDSFSIFNSPFSIVRHRLVGKGVVQLECPKNRRGVAGPDMIILHYTAGRDVIGKFPDSGGCKGFGTFDNRERRAGDTVGTV